MNSKLFKFSWRLAIAAWLVGMVPLASFAASLTWDGNVGSAGLQDGSGNWNTSNTDRWWNGASYVTWNNVNNDTAVIGVNNGTAGTISLTTGITAGGINFNPAGTGAYVITGNTLTLAGTTPTITSNVASATAPSISSVIAGTAGLSVTGEGMVILNPASTSYTGTTSIVRGAGGNGSSSFGGVLRLDYANTAGASTTNLISSASPLVMQGGTLYVVGKSASSNAQTFSGTTFNAGSNYIRVDNLGTAMALNLGAITRNVGSTINFTGASSGTRTTTTANTATSILGGWAVVSNDWAVTGTGGGTYTVSALGAGSYTNDAWSAANNTLVVSAATAPAANSTTNSLKFQEGSALATTVTLSGTNVISSGGILNPGSRTNSTTITGGSLTSGNGLDLIAIHFGTTPFTISSNIVNNGATPIGFTALAIGTITLDGTAKTYTGPTTIADGQLRTDVVNVLPIGTAVNITNYSSTFAASLNLNNNNQTIGSLAGGGSVTLGSGQLTIGGSTTTTYDGVISGTGALVRQGSGTTILAGTNTYTGALTLNAGIVNAATAGINGSSTTNGIVFGGGTLQAATGGISTAKAITGTSGSFDTNGNNSVLSGSITLSGTLNKLGSGSLTLSGTNSIDVLFMTTGGGTLVLNSSLGGSGTKTVQGGTELAIGLNNPLGVGTFALGGATVRSTNATARSLNNIMSMASNGTTTFGTASTGDLTFSGIVTLIPSVGVVTWQVDNATTTFSNAIGESGGAKNLSKTGTGTLLLSGNNTYTGDTVISLGTLELGGNQRIDNASDLVLNGGTFATAGFSETLATLDVNSSSTINLGSGTSILSFLNSSALGWSGTLTINNWSGLLVGGGADRLFVGTNTSGLTAGQLSQIHFTGYAVGAAILATGEVVPVPEPSTFATLFFGSMMLWFVKRKRIGT